MGGVLEKTQSMGRGKEVSMQVDGPGHGVDGGIRSAGQRLPWSREKKKQMCRPSQASIWTPSCLGSSSKISSPSFATITVYYAYI
jgi:hypothetical protein